MSKNPADPDRLERDLEKAELEIDQAAQDHTRLVDSFSDHGPPLPEAVHDRCNDLHSDQDPPFLDEIDPDPADPIDDPEWDEIPDRAWLEFTRILTNIEQIYFSLSELEGSARQAQKAFYTSLELDARIRFSTRRIERCLDPIIEALPVLAVAVVRVLDQPDHADHYRDFVRTQINTIRAHRQGFNKRRSEK